MFYNTDTVREDEERGEKAHCIHLGEKAHRIFPIGFR
jgi:hypothetical protein